MKKLLLAFAIALLSLPSTLCATQKLEVTDFTLLDGRMKTIPISAPGYINGEPLRAALSIKNNNETSTLANYGMAMVYTIDDKYVVEEVIYEKEINIEPNQIYFDTLQTKYAFSNHLVKTAPQDVDGMRSVAPVIKNQAGEWEIQLDNIETHQAATAPKSFYTDNVTLSAQSVARNEKFRVYAPAMTLDGNEQELTIGLYKYTAISMFRYEYDLVAILDRQQENQYYDCVVPEDVEAGEYYVIPVHKEAPIKMEASGIDYDRFFEKYAPITSPANRYIHQFNQITVLDKTLKYDLAIYYFDGPSEIEAGNMFRFSIGLKSYSLDVFSGRGSLVLMQDNKIKMTSKENTRIKLSPTLKAFWLGNIDDSETIDIEPGEYKVSMVVNMNYDDDNWEIVEKSEVENDITILPRFITGIQNSAESNDKVHVFPNPVTDILNIEQGNQIMESATLFDTTGTLIQTIGSETHKMDMSGLAKGIYILKVKTDKGTNTLKINKK